MSKQFSITKKLIAVLTALSVFVSTSHLGILATNTQAAGIDDLILQNKTITNGQAVDYEAENSITAGNFLIQDGANVSFTAGQRIKLLAGFKGEEGAYFKAQLSAGTDESLTQDSDGDGLPDYWEIANNLNPNDPGDAAQDPDGDGLSNLEEMIRGSNPHGSDDSYTPPTREPLPSVSGTIAGYTAGNFSVSDSGVASYSIPIAVSPGTGGMEPKISLNYNSRGGNGIVGVGWSVGGLSSISRCPTTHAQDGFVNGIDFDANDKLSLDGQRLIAINGTYGANGAEYRTEIESFSKIIGYNNFNGSGSYFKVWTKDGLIYEYGNTADSRIEAQGKTIPLTWNANKISDTKGNYFTISYEEFNANGESYPTRIDYTGNSAGLFPYNSVRFVYEDRADNLNQYIGGSVIKTTKRLQKIQIYSGDSLVREYQMDYNNESKTQKSRLTQVRECDGDGQCFAPTVFGWEQKETTDHFALPSPDTPAWWSGTSGNNDGQNWPRWSDGGGDYTVLQDMNGDGLPDRVAHHNYKTNISGLWVALNNGTGFDAQELWWNTNNANNDQNRPRWSNINNDFTILIDIDGDGLPDRISHYNYGTGVYGLWVALNTGDGFDVANQKNWGNPSPNNNNENLPRWGDGEGETNGDYATFLDMNGDNLPDRVYWNGQAGLYVALNTGDGFDFDTAKSWWTGTNGNQNRPNLKADYGTATLLLDMNGDGLPDRVSHYNYQTDTPGLWVALNTGNGFDVANQKKWWAGTDGNNDGQNWPIWSDGGGDYTVLLDMNSDGLPDRVGHANYHKNPAETGLWVALNTGDGFAEPALWWKGDSSATDAQNRPNWTDPNGSGAYTKLLDIDNDLFPDHISHYNYSENKSGLWVALNNGHGFESDTCWYPTTSNDGQNQVVWSGPYGNAAILLDMNGDGFADRVGHYNYETNTPGLWVAFNTNVQDKLTSITTGHGATTDISYKTITDDSVYTKEDTAAYPYRDFQSPLYVVSEYTAGNGIGGESKISYKYKGLKVHQQGRGLTAFREVSKNNHQTGITSTSYYHQEFPLNGRAEKTETHLSDGTLISEAGQTWQVRDLENGCYFLYLEQSVSRQYELNGDLVGTSTSSNQYDDYGNITNITVSADDGYSTTTFNTYDNDTYNWLLGRLRTATVTAGAPNQFGVSVPTQSRRSAFEYNPANGLLIKEITDPGGSKEVSKTYVYDAYGNITETTISGADIETRSTETAYDSSGRFVKTTTNALEHTESKNYDESFGLVSSLTGPNNLTTSWDYDGFGRKTLETRTDGTQARISRFLCDSGNPGPDTFVEGQSFKAVYLVRTDSSGSAPVIEYNDLLNRTIRTEATGFNGRKIFADTLYNSKGQKWKVSDPYFEGDTPLWTSYTYDELGRVITVQTPDGSTISTAYNGRTTTITNALGQNNTKIVNSQGKATISTDNDYNSNKFIYNAFGNLMQLKDPANNVISMEYDAWGNKTAIHDPDMGDVSYTYNALGELKTQTDANGNTVSMQYDKLGRLIKRIEPEGTSIWVYDSKDKGIGKLARITAPDNYSEDYTYDTLGRLYQTGTTINGETFRGRVFFDQYGRAAINTYPTAFSTKNVYNTYGYLAEVRNANISENTIYWKAQEYNARGQLEQQVLGNDLTTNWTYDETTGFLEDINTGSGAIQDLTYNFDAIGNLKYRIDNRQDIQEDFEYDNLNRLRYSTVRGQPTREIRYNSIGNIDYRSDVGIYNYDKDVAGPHAVISITEGPKANSYTYDDNGNRERSNDGTIAYTSFNKPHTIKKGEHSTLFKYGPSRARYQREDRLNNGTTSLTIYLGMYEREDTGTRKHKHYIAGGDGVVAVHTIENSSSQTHYLHRDHINSIDTITDETGQVAERLSYDAWGKRRNPNWTDATQIINTELTRGFTGHEHIDDVELIHMNGRVYDPVIGRFLSADPFIQAPENTQSPNRYSYVFNNPLSYTDPSGFLSFGDALKIAVIVGATIVTGGAAAAAFAGLGGLGAAVVGGAVGGFVGGFTGAALNGANFSQAMQAGLNGGLRGAISAGMFHGIGDAFAAGGMFGELEGAAHYGAKVFAHGVGGGLREIMQPGGKFEHGFLSGAFTQAFSPGINKIDSTHKGINPYRAVAAAIVGGTAAELGGGKFANGAVTGAFSRMFNDEFDHNRAKKIEEKMRRGSFLERLFGLNRQEESLYPDAYPNIERRNLLLQKIYNYKPPQLDELCLNAAMKIPDPVYSIVGLGLSFTPAAPIGYAVTGMGMLKTFGNTYVYNNASMGVGNSSLGLNALSLTPGPFGKVYGLGATIFDTSTTYLNK
jgi:RHS repeat-associated protein